LVSDAREAVALGHVYLRAHIQAQGVATLSSEPGLHERALASFRRALDQCRSPRGAYDPIRIDALRALAIACRRARRHDEAASAWGELAAMRGCPAPIMREASEALAIHHEHRVRDLESAKAFAIQSLKTDCGPSWAGAARYRLARLERKISGGTPEGRTLEFEAEV
jgi:hypothetical protein